MDQSYTFSACLSVIHFCTCIDKQQAMGVEVLSSLIQKQTPDVACYV